MVVWLAGTTPPSAALVVVDGHLRCCPGPHHSGIHVTLARCNTSCSAGYYCTSDSPSSVAVTCPVGSYCPTGIMTGVPLTCPSNMYSIGGAAVCTPCPDATVTSSSGAGECLSLQPVPVWNASRSNR